MYFETIRRADAEGYGSRSSLLGTMDTKIVAITDNPKVSQTELLDTLSVQGTKIDDHQFIGMFESDELVSLGELEALRGKIPSLIESNRNGIYGQRE